MKRYFTTSKTGEEVEVSKDLAKQLIGSGKKTYSDFQIEEDDSPELVATKQEPQDMESYIRGLARTTIEPFKRTVRPFAEGAVSGASFDTIKPEVPVNEPKLESTARTVGKFVGGTIPIVAAGMTGGAAGAIGGLGPVGQAVATGLTYGAAKAGAERQNPLTEAPGEMSKQAAIFGTLEGGGKILFNAVKNLAGDISENMANWFLNTPKATAEKLLDQMKPSLGKQALEKGVLTEGAMPLNRKEVYNRASFSAKRLQNQVNGKLGQLSEEGRVVELEPIVNDLQAVATRKAQSFGADSPETKSYQTVMDNFISGKQSKLDILEANKVRQDFDKSVNKAYTRIGELPPGLQAEEDIANALRKSIASKSPELQDLLSQEHFWLMIQNSLRPVVAGHGIGTGPSVFNRGLGALLGTRGESGIASSVNWASKQGNPTLGELIKTGAIQVSEGALSKKAKQFKSNKQETVK